MQIRPVHSAVSFGQKDNKKTLTVPTAVVGTIGGLAYAHNSKIKLDKDSYEKTIDIIDEKLDKNHNLESRFSFLKEKFEAEKQYNNTQLEKLGITAETKEISVDDLLKNYVYNDSKTVEGLGHDIKYAQGETSVLKDDALALKLKDIEEKTFIKNLAEKAKDGKVNADEVRAYFAKQIKENKFIKDEIQSFADIVDNFNKKRYWLFAAIGLLAGGTIGYMIKLNKKDK